MSSEDPVTPKCPSRAVLAAYLRGKLTPAQAEVVKEHVYACSTCAATVNHFLKFAKKNQTGAVQFARLDDDGAKWKYAALGFVAAIAVGGAAWFFLRPQATEQAAPAPAEVSTDAAGTDAAITDPPPTASATAAAPEATPTAAPSATAEAPAPTPTATPSPTAEPTPPPATAPTPSATSTPTATPTPTASATP